MSSSWLSFLSPSLSSSWSSLLPLEERFDFYVVSCISLCSLHHGSFFILFISRFSRVILDAIALHLLFFGPVSLFVLSLLLFLTLTWMVVITTLDLPSSFRTRGKGIDLVTVKDSLQVLHVSLDVMHLPVNDCLLLVLISIHSFLLFSWSPSSLSYHKSKDDSWRAVDRLGIQMRE